MSLSNEVLEYNRVELPLENSEQKLKSFQDLSSKLVLAMELICYSEELLFGKNKIGTGQIDRPLDNINPARTGKATKTATQPNYQKYLKKLPIFSILTIEFIKYAQKNAPENGQKLKFNQSAFLESETLKSALLPHSLLHKDFCKNGNYRWLEPYVKELVSKYQGWLTRANDIGEDLETFALHEIRGYGLFNITKPKR